MSQVKLKRIKMKLVTILFANTNIMFLICDLKQSITYNEFDVYHRILVRSWIKWLYIIISQRITSRWVILIFVVVVVTHFNLNLIHSSGLFYAHLLTCHYKYDDHVYELYEYLNLDYLSCCCTFCQGHVKTLVTEVKC